nr:retrovirus-related Pol polyprotein from transposon TNT 1-94 [Tanacetum cinerariifolium]
MEILIQTCLMPLALKTQNDSFIFVHELKQEMHADFKYVESLEKKIDELESDKAEFSNMYDIILQEFDSDHFACVTKMLNDVNARTKPPNVVPISTRKPKGHANKSVATSHKKKIASKSTTQKPKSYYRMLYEKTMITVRTDRGTEFLNKTLHAFFKEEGIEHQTSTARTPEQNNVVKRQNRTLVEAARTMLSALKLPLFFWAEAIAIVCYTQNRSIIISTHDKTAYHIINDRKPSVKHLYIFGCICYLTKDGENLDNMKEKGDPCILVGYSTQSKGYPVYNKRTRLIVKSIHIRFDEIKEMSETSVTNDTSGLVPQR